MEARRRKERVVFTVSWLVGKLVENSGGEHVADEEETLSFVTRFRQFETLVAEEPSGLDVAVLNEKLDVGGEVCEAGLDEAVDVHAVFVHFLIVPRFGSRGTSLVPVREVAHRSPSLVNPHDADDGYRDEKKTEYSQKRDVLDGEMDEMYHRKYLMNLFSISRRRNSGSDIMVSKS